MTNRTNKLTSNIDEEGAIMKINHNGSKWLGEAPDSIDVLKKRLKENKLDREVADVYFDTTNKRINVFGNFTDISHAFSVDFKIDDPEAIKLINLMVLNNL